MAGLLQNFFGKPPAPSPEAIPIPDADFADFAASSPAPPVPSSNPGDLPSVTTRINNVQSTPNSFLDNYLPFRRLPSNDLRQGNTSRDLSFSDFYLEACILPFLLLIIGLHFWGTRKNKSKAQSWMNAHSKVLENEFAIVGFPTEASTKELASTGKSADNGMNLLKEKSKDMFLSYATGRQNIAFIDIKLSLLKRYNPLALFMNQAIGFVMESSPATTEQAEITAYAFDGREVDLVEQSESEIKVANSSYTGFICAVVHKDRMRTLRDQRYDLSLTVTKDNPKLPNWLTTMSENAELTELLLTTDMINAIKACGDDFIALIISDLPEDAPKTHDDLFPKKRLCLMLKLNDPSTTSTNPSTNLLTQFIRLTDVVIANKPRPEVLRKIKETREIETKKIEKQEQSEKSEARKTQNEKTKREEREKKLKSMNADEQRRFLERERERDVKRSMGRRTIKG